MSPKIGVADARREQVMQAALQRLVESGYCALSVREVAKAAGVSTGVLYHYFQNKDDIVIHSLAAAFTDTDRELRERVDQSPRGMDRLQAYLRLAAALGRTDPTTVQVLMNAFGQANYSPAIGSRLARLFASFRSYANRTLTEALQEEGVELDPQRRQNLAAIIVGVGIGLSLQWAIDPGAVDPDGCGLELERLFGTGLEQGGESDDGLSSDA